MNADDPGTQARWRRRARIALAGLAALHLLRAGLFAGAGPAPLYRDALGYWQLASRVVAGDPFWMHDPEATRTPGYPWLVAGFQALFDDHALFAATAFQQLALAGSAFLAAWIARAATGSPLAAPLALALGLFCVSRHLLASYLWSGNLLGLVLTAAAAAYVAWWRRPSALRALALGALFGLAVLVRPVAELAWLAALPAMALRLRQRPGGAGRRVLRHAGALVLGVALLVAPWLARNQAAFGEPFLTRFAGRTLWVSCYHPHAGALPFPDLPALDAVFAHAGGPEVDRRDAWSVYAALRSAGLGEIEADDLMARAAIASVLAQPRAFAATVVRQSAWFWAVPYRIPRWRHDDPWVELEGRWEGQVPWHSPRLLRARDALLAGLWHPSAGRFAAAAVLVGLGLAAMAARPRQRSLAVFFAGVLLYFAFVTAAASYPIYRFRAVLEPLMVAVLAIAATPWLDRCLGLRAGGAGDRSCA